jgi:Transposase IS116/IS110/IS902 family
MNVRNELVKSSLGPNTDQRWVRGSPSENHRPVCPFCPGHPQRRIAQPPALSSPQLRAADMRRMTRASAACRRVMTIPGVGQLTALAFVAAIDDPSRIRRSRDVGAYLGLVPRRYHSATSTTSAASRDAGIDGCGPCCTKPPTSC